MGRLRNAVGVYGHAAGRGNWRGVIQLEVTASVYGHTTGRGHQPGVAHLGITTSVYDLAASREPRH
ncbi:hypothetical protein [Streptomyces prunicolor]|uniref:Uncharacterized protein n=1 Tax=Streptomyces prunicolor TaxID=67348 RepID=A0ABU4FFF8_9ACTN|nr:hypothetical protein [Streptomyces prunicolor]MDV7219333.1 hypothetical protein [Streptomyces prunicolor]